MRSTSILFVLILLMASCTQPKADGFSIQAEVVNGNGTTVKISQRADGKWIDLDSTVVAEDGFELNGKVDNPQMLYLRIMEEDDKRFRYVPIFSDNANKIAIKGDLTLEDDMAITGSTLNDLHKQYQNAYDEETGPLLEIYEMYKVAKDQGVKDSLEAVMEDIEAQGDKVTYDFILENAASPVAAYIAMRNYSYGKEFEDLKPLVDKMKAAKNPSETVARLQEKLDVLQKVAIGQVAPTFTQNDENGEEFNIESLRGKYVLIDFWASWCGPCRRENPNVVAMYKDFGGDNFEILGVSLDRKEEDWKKAIVDDKLTWEHVSDLQYFDNEVAKLYAVNAIPQTYLLDKNGVIIAKNLYGKKLREKVKSLLETES